MKSTHKIAAVAAAVGVGAAAARLYTATHPPDVTLDRPKGPGRTPPPDELFDLPEVTPHELPTPDGGVIHAIERGSGRPVVLLHGITLRSDVWAPQLNEMADRFRVIAVDLRGHGRSVAGDAGFGIGVLADDLAVVLEALDLRDAVVVGHSMGGMTAMAFCGAHPDVLAARVAGLVFVATRAHRVLPPSANRAARSVLGRGQQMVAGGRALPAATEVNTRAARLAFGDRPSPKAVGIVAEMGRSMVPEALMPSLAGLIEHDARDALRATNTPALVVVGTRDVLTPVPAGRHLAHLLPDSELAVLPRAGHQLMQERPRELAALLDAFVARIDHSADSVADGVRLSGGPVSADQIEGGPAST